MKKAFTDNNIPERASNTSWSRYEREIERICIRKKSGLWCHISDCDYSGENSRLASYNRQALTTSTSHRCYFSSSVECIINIECLFLWILKPGTLLSSFVLAIMKRLIWRTLQLPLHSVISDEVFNMVRILMTTTLTFTFISPIAISTITHSWLSNSKPIG